MNSSISDCIETAMQKLYQILIMQQEVQQPLSYIRNPQEQSSITIFERYLPENNTLFLYAYDSDSFIIFKQCHFEVDKISPNQQQYYIILKNFLTELLASNEQLCIYFLNYGTYILTDLQQKYEEALNLLDLNLPHSKNKIIICMDWQQITKIKEGFLNLKISSNQLALLKYHQDLIKEVEKYEIYTLNKIFEINQIHQKFIEVLTQNEQYVGMFNVFTLIKDLTKLDNIPNSSQYLAQFLFNLSKYTQQETLRVIQILKLCLQKTQNQTLNKNKLQRKELWNKFQSQLAIFKDEKNWHFPKKGAHSQKCKVCQKLKKDSQDKIRKSSYICHSCQKFYKINITLCTIECFKLFHLNPGLYMGRIKKKSIRKTLKMEE